MPENRYWGIRLCELGLQRFLREQHNRAGFNDSAVLADFLKLDDHDIMGAAKVWCDHADRTLARLATDLVTRRNLRITLQNSPWSDNRIAELRKQVADQLGIPLAEAERFVIAGRVVNNAYDPTNDRIELLYKDGSLHDIAEASDNLGIAALSKPVEKWYLAWPRWAQG